VKFSLDERIHISYPESIANTEVSMRLSCQPAFLLLFAATIGCHDTTAPFKIPTQFLLENINGRQVPTYLSATPGLTPTILGASLTFEEAGKAVMTEDRREFDGTETTITNTFDYKIHGNAFEVGFFGPCPPNANCVGTYKGTISGQTLSLTIAALSIDGSIIYNYRIAPTL
jgi:hypothetical protein